MHNCIKILRYIFYRKVSITSVLLQTVTLICNPNCIFFSKVCVILTAPKVKFIAADTLSWQNIIPLRDTTACQTLAFLVLSWAVDLLRWLSVICNMNATEMAYRTVHSSRVLCVREFYCQDKKIVTMETNFISSRRPEQYKLPAQNHSPVMPVFQLPPIISLRFYFILQLCGRNCEGRVLQSTLLITHHWVHV